MKITGNTETLILRVLFCQIFLSLLFLKNLKDLLPLTVSIAKMYKHCEKALVPYYAATIKFFA